MKILDKIVVKENYVHRDIYHNDFPDICQCSIQIPAACRCPYRGDRDRTICQHPLPEHRLQSGNQSHLGLDFFIGFMPAKVRKVLSVAATVLAIILCGTMFYYGVLMVRQEMFLEQVTAAMQWPEWIYGLTVPVGAAILVLRYLIGLVSQIAGWKEEK